MKILYICAGSECYQSLERHFEVLHEQQELLKYGTRLKRLNKQQSRVSKKNWKIDHKLT